MKYLSWLALLAAAATAAGPIDSDTPTPATAEVVDVASVEIVDEPAVAEDELAEPLRRIAEELDRTLEDQRGPAWQAPEVPAGDFVAAVP